MAGSLPRFTATSRTRPGLTVGSTLDGGPNWADDARCVLVACEVDGGVVITLMTCRTCITCPVFGPADILHMPTGMAGFRRREPAVSDHQLRPVPTRLIGQLPPRCAQGRIGESTPSGAGTRQTLLPHHPRRVQTFNIDPAVGFSQSCCQNVEVMSANIVDPAVQPGNLGGALAVPSRAFRAARPCPAQLPQLPQRGIKRTRIPNLSTHNAVSVSDRREPTDPDINTHPRLGLSHASGCWGRCTTTRTLASRRVPLRRTLIANTRARPARMRRSILRVFSCVRTVPITGSVRWRRSGSTRIAPVVKHTRSASRPLRLEARKPDPFPGALASAGRLPVPVGVHRAVDAAA